MTDSELKAESRAFGELAAALKTLADELAVRRDGMAHGDTGIELSATYNMVMRSIEEASVTANAAETTLESAVTSTRLASA